MRVACRNLGFYELMLKNKFNLGESDDCRDGRIIKDAQAVHASASRKVGDTFYPSLRGFSMQVYLGSGSEPVMNVPVSDPAMRALNYESWGHFI